MVEGLFLTYDFADDIDLMDGSRSALQDLTNRLVDRTMAYGMEVSTEKSKTMTTSTNNFSADVTMNDQKLEEVTSFKYLGAILCKDGTCSAEVRIKIASAMAAMARLNRIWRSNTISFPTKFKLYKSLVASILLYGLTAYGICLLTLKKRSDPGFETKCMKKLSPHLLLGAQDQRQGAEQDQLPWRSTGTSSGNSQETEFAWFRHVTRHDNLSKIIL